MNPFIAIMIVAAMMVGATCQAAFAAGKHRHPRWEASRAQYLGAAPRAYGRDPYGVYWGGRKIGRDPDPNVRRSLLQEWFDIYER